MGPRDGGTSLSTLADRLAAVIEPVTRRAGFDLEQVRVSRLGRRHSVQVVVDRDGGVGLDAIAEVSHEVSAALDAAEAAGAAAVPGEYVLEVSSPGVDRPLTEPRHWRRNVGRLVKVTPHEGEPVVGRITDAGETTAVLDVDGSSRDVAYADVRKARVEVEFNRKED